MIEFNIEGVEAEIRRIEAEVEKREKAAQQVLEKWGERLMLEAKRNAPVDTGALRDSISWTVDGTVVTVHVGVDYAIYVEYGTVNMAGRYYLSNAVISVRQQFLQELAEAVQ